VRVHGSGPAFKTIEAPSVLGEIAFLDGGPRSASLVAETDGELVRFDMDAFEALAAAEPDLGRRIALDLGRVAAVRLRLLSERLEP
jgi:CRP/FNR family transcriptional regulator, cyclic AMP receptor protein